MLRLSVLGADEQVTEIEAILDTGFTGYLTLPGATIEELALPSRGVREAILADGSTVVLEVYRAGVIWDGKLRGVQVLASDDVPALRVRVACRSRGGRRSRDRRAPLRISSMSFVRYSSLRRLPK